MDTRDTRGGPGNLFPTVLSGTLEKCAINHVNWAIELFFLRILVAVSVQHVFLLGGK